MKGFYSSFKVERWFCDKYEEDWGLDSLSLKTLKTNHTKHLSSVFVTKPCKVFDVNASYKQLLECPQ